METLNYFYLRALEAFRKAGGTDKEFKWFVGVRLVWYPVYRNEIRLRLRLAEEIVKRSEGRILDVGSGSGFLALELSRKGEVVGIEREEGLFEFLKSLENDRLRFLNIDFLKDDIEGKFDTIVFSYILHDFEPKPFLEKALKLLEQDGKIIIGDFDVNDLKNKIREFAKENKLEITDEMTLGKAKTHGNVHDAFLMVLRLPLSSSFHR